MNKADLVGHVAEDLMTSKLSAETIVDSVLAAIGHGLSSDEGVAVVGFGTFQVRQRAERRGRNPQTGEAITIPAGKSIRFRPGKHLRDCVGA